MVRLYWPPMTKKGSEMGKKGGKKQKIAYSEAKYDFQVPKINSLAV